MTRFKRILSIGLLCTLFSPGIYAENRGELLNHQFDRLSPKGTVNLKEEYAGKVILAVNTASACGFTPQYEGLETLYQKYKAQGLVVLGFPSNDFYQEKKDGNDIVEFCRLNYGVSFPIFKKSSVKGKKANPFYKDLASAYNDKFPKWNFFKYLINQDQEVVGLYSSREKPLGGQLESEIQRLLAGAGTSP